MNSIIAKTRSVFNSQPKLVWLLIAAAIAIICYAYLEYKERTNLIVYFEKDDRYEGFANITIGGNKYKIHEDLSDPQKAAETMDKLNTVAQALISNLYGKYIDNPDGLNGIKPEKRDSVSNGIKALKNNFKTANMEENIPERSGGDTSYVINKGSVFAMCLRDPTNGNQIDPKFNALTFVLIHEMAHLACPTFGHDELFWNGFKFLLQEAVAEGLYISEDYKTNGSPYCGIVITYSPLFDPKLEEYHI